MSRIHIIIGDPHAHPNHNNNRALHISRLIADLRPDVVVQLGDAADMPSLSSYDKGKRSFQGRSYAADIAAHSDFQDKLWHYVRRQKKKLPMRVALIGNHEERIDRALNLQPELTGTIGYEDLDLEKYYDVVVPYSGQTPGVIEIDGVFYAHYFTSGVMGNSVSGEHQAYTLLAKKFSSCTQGHTHTFDHCMRTSAGGKKIIGLVAGCAMDYKSDWAGEVENLWWRGVFIKRGVEDGHYDLEAVSLSRLAKEYGDL